MRSRSRIGSIRFLLFGSFEGPGLSPLSRAERLPRSRLPELLQDPDPGLSKRVMKAMMRMTKIDIAMREAAADGRERHEVRRMFNKKQGADQ